MKNLRVNFSMIKQLLFIFFLLGAAFIFAMFQGGFFSYFILYSLVPFFLYSVIFLFYPIEKMELERIIDNGQVRKGSDLHVVVRVKRNSRFPLLYATMEEKVSSSLKTSMPFGELQTIRQIGFRKELQWNYKLVAVARGEHELKEITVELTDFFGWVKKTHTFKMKQKLLVYPNVVDIVYMPIETRYDYGATASPFTKVKDTTMAIGVREYQPGDRFSWIHWKSFAKTETLRTKEFEDRQSQELFVMLDCANSKAFEETVDLTASIVQAVHRSQATVAFLSVGKTRFYLPVIQSEDHVRKAMLHLAKVKDDLVVSKNHPIVRDEAIATATTLLIVTGKLTPILLSSIPKAARNLRQAIIFVVLKKGEQLSKEDIAVHEHARASGMIVKVLTTESFATAFLEVTK